MHRQEVFFGVDNDVMVCKTPSGELKYRIFQIYGQRYVKLINYQREPSFRSEIYASNIPRDIALEEVFRFFSRCGEIFQIRLLMDFSGYNRGRCFVQYKTVQAARQAVCCLHDEVIQGSQTVCVKISLNNNQLLLRSIPIWIPEEHLKEILFEVIGTGLQRVTVKSSKWPMKNICFCRYETHQFAIMAHKKAWPYINVSGAIIDVHWAVPELTKNATNLYFTNFPLDMTKKEFFQRIIEKVEVNNFVQFRIPGFYGYITFTNLSSLIKAESSINRMMIRGFQLTCSRTPFEANVERLSPEPISIPQQVPASVPYFPVEHYPPPMRNGFSPYFPSASQINLYGIPQKQFQQAVQNYPICGQEERECIRSIVKN